MNIHKYKVLKDAFIYIFPSLAFYISNYLHSFNGYLLLYLFHSTYQRCAGWSVAMPFILLKAWMCFSANEHGLTWDLKRCLQLMSNCNVEISASKPVVVLWLKLFTFLLAWMRTLYEFVSCHKEQLHCLNIFTLNSLHVWTLSLPSHCMSIHIHCTSTACLDLFTEHSLCA